MEWLVDLQEIGPLPPDCDLESLEVPPCLAYLLHGLSVRAKRLVTFDDADRIVRLVQDIDDELGDEGKWLCIRVAESEGWPDQRTLSSGKILYAAWWVRPEHEQLWDEIRWDGVHPGKDWPERFGLLALLHVAEALQIWRDHDMPWDEPPDKIPFGLAGRVAGAQECVELAERVQIIDGYEGKLARGEDHHVRERARKGGKARHRATDDLRKFLMSIHDYDSLGERSARNAAHRLYEKYKKEIDTVLSTDDPVKRIEKWVGAHRRMRIDQ